MSYILEALKKAEQEGEDEGAPKLLSYSASAAPKPRRRPLWPYLLVTVLLLNAGMIFWWAHFRQPDEQQMVGQAPVVSETPVIPQTPALHLEVAAAPVEKPPASTGPERMSRRSIDLKNDAKGDTKRVPEKREAASPLPTRLAHNRDRKATPTAIEKADTVAPAPAQLQPPAEGLPRAIGKVLRLDELPPAVRGRLPAFKVSGHAYSPDAASRVARINDQIVQEGGSLAPGIKVEEITPEGIVLGYQGYRFQVSFNPN